MTSQAFHKEWENKAPTSLEVGMGILSWIFLLDQDKCPHHFRQQLCLEDCCFPSLSHMSFLRARTLFSLNVTPVAGGIPETLTV
jgi:hypothetical protein